ncbi:hypothetical protein Pgin02_00302 [Porphyromonas gingivalis]
MKYFIAFRLMSVELRELILQTETFAQYPPLISIKTDTCIDLTKKGELHAISLQTSSNLKNT